MSQVKFAELLGISKRNTYSNYEKGVSTPPEEVIRQICNIANVPLGFFYKCPPEKKNQSPFFRSMEATTKFSRSRSEVRLGWFRELVEYADLFVEMPKPNVPKFVLPERVEAITMDEIEEIAEGTRNFWGLKRDPIGNMTWLLERNGVCVANVSMEDEKQDGVSDWLGNPPRPYVLVNADKTSAARQRFNIAHELGHILLHENADRDRMKEDKDYFELIESQAHRFASAFLFPAISFVREMFMINIELMKQLKQRWNVSIASMIRRAYDLKMIDEHKKANLFRSLGGRKKEFLDDVVPMESPKLLYKAIMFLLDKNVNDRSTLKSELPLNPQEIEAFASLPEGFLREQEAEIVELRPSVSIRSRVLSQRIEREPAKVVPLFTAAKSSN